MGVSTWGAMYSAIKHFHFSPAFAARHFRLVPPLPVTFHTGSAPWNMPR